MEPEYEVKFYELRDGTAPAYEFIEAQPSKMNVKIYRTIKLLESRGTSLRMPYSEHLQDGIFELRTDIGTNATRVLYFFMIGKEIILTNGFVKKTRKTPPDEIELAKKYRADYLLHHGKNYKEKEV